MDLQDEGDSGRLGAVIFVAVFLALLCHDCVAPSRAHASPGIAEAVERAVRSLEHIEQMVDKISKERVR